MTDPAPYIIVNPDDLLLGAAVLSVFWLAAVAGAAVFAWRAGFNAGAVVQLRAWLNVGGGS